MIKAAVRWALLLGLLSVTSLVTAHTRSESQTSWTIDGRLIRVSATVPDLEAQRIARSAAAPSDAALLAYLEPRIGAAAGTVACRPTVAPRMLGAATGFRRAELTFDCPGSAPIRLRFAAFFDLVASHIDLAQIQFANEDFIEQVFTQDQQILELKDQGGGALREAGFLRFIAMGVMHIFTGVDHMSFLIGLVLISRRLRDLIFVVTGFTIGHSMTLALAVTGILRPHAQFIDALVALTIALIGVENIVATLSRPSGLALASGALLVGMAGLAVAGVGTLPPLLLLGAGIFTCCYLYISGHLQDAGRLRMVVTMVFGLIHGFGFAADLLESRLPTEKLVEILVGFNVGVEIGQLCVVLAVTSLVTLLRRTHFALTRAVTVDVTASALVALGMFWFIGRSFG